MIKYSIIATSFNDASSIDTYMKSIMDFEIQPEELVIVDGGSKDNTRDEILKYSDQVNFDIVAVFDGVRRNISEGYNAAIKKCREEWILITGIGNSYNPTYVNNLIQALENTEADMAYGPFIGNNVNGFSKIYNKAFLKGNRPFDYGQASNRGVLIRKNVFEKCGYFYEHFVYAGEDSEYYSRVKNYNIKSIYTKKAVVSWDPPTNLQQAMKKTRVNAIADLQLMDLKKLVLKDLLLYMYALAIIAGAIVSPMISMLGVLALYIYAVYKIKCCNILSVILWVYNLYYTGYQHFMQRKYAAKEFRFNLTERSE